MKDIDSIIVKYSSNFSGLMEFRAVPENVFVKVDKNIHLYNVEDKQDEDMFDSFILVQMHPDQGSFGYLLGNEEEHYG